MQGFRNAAIACGMLLLSGCATQTYTARHASSSELTQIRGTHVISVIDQKQLDAQYNTTYVNPIVTGAPIVPALAGGLIAGALISAEANHEAHVFAETHIAPLLTTLSGYDGRAAIQQSLQQNLGVLPVHLSGWSSVDSKAKDSDLLPADAPMGSAWLILRTHYAMTPDFSGLQVTTKASLFVHGQNADWRNDPVYKNDFTYQSALLRMPEKSESVRKQMADKEDARYAKLDIDQQVAKANAADPYDPANAKLREKIHDEQWQHEAKLKQIASPFWNPDERASHFVKEWQANDAASLKQDMTEGGTQTARMVALDLGQQQPQANDSKRDWITVYRDAQRTIQDAPDGAVYSVANGDVTHQAVFVNQNVNVHVAPNAR